MEETVADQRNRCLLHRDLYATHSVGRNGCQDFFFVLPALTNRCTLNVEIVTTAGETEICACEMQRVITVQLLYCLLHRACIESVLDDINPLNAELNPICYLQALLAHDFLHVSRIRVKSLTLR
jgi:hypothetical protein